jgi:DNA-binding PadR family transcriptional regulator
LVDEGLLESKETKGRRTYTLTEAGKAVAAAEIASPAPWDTTIDRPSGPRSDLAVAGVKLAKAAADVARLGSTDQIEKATELLHETTATLAAMLKHN